MYDDQSMRLTRGWGKSLPFTPLRHKLTPLKARMSQSPSPSHGTSSRGMTSSRYGTESRPTPVSQHTRGLTPFLLSNVAADLQLGEPLVLCVRGRNSVKRGDEGGSFVSQARFCQLPPFPKQLDSVLHVCFGTRVQGRGVVGIGCPIGKSQVSISLSSRPS